MLIYLPLLILVVLAISILFSSEHRAKSKRQRYFLKRSVISFDDWYVKFYGNQGPNKELAYQICMMLGKDVGVQGTQIYPTDRFDQELKCEGTLRGHELENFQWQVERFFKAKGKKAPDVSLIFTVGDLITTCDVALNVSDKEG